MTTRKYNKVKKNKKSKKGNKSKRQKNKTKYTRKRIKGGSSNKKKLTWEKDDDSSLFSNVINSNYVQTFLKDEPSLTVNTDLSKLEEGRSKEISRYSGKGILKKKKGGKRKIYSKGGGLLQSKFIEQEQEIPECSICQDLINEDNNITTPCGHSFHINCLLEWCRRHNLATTCPLCRDPIPDICAELLPDLIQEAEERLIQLPFPNIPDVPDIPDIIATTDIPRVSPRASPLTITDLNIETNLLPQIENVSRRVRHGFLNDLEGAYLEGIDLNHAVMRQANLVGADLTNANLQGADLRNANLRGAILVDTDLRGANLRGANLTNAYLLNTDLRRADLTNVNIRGTNLSGANLYGTIGLGFVQDFDEFEESNIDDIEI